MNVINDPSIGSLSRSLGTGLGRGLQRLAEDRYKQLHERQQVKKATDTGAYTPEVAAFIQSLPEKDRYQAYQMLAQEPNQEQVSGQQEPQQNEQPNNQAQQQRQPSFAERIRGGTGTPQQRKEQYLLQREADKETKAYYNNVLSLQDAAKFSEMRLGKMEKLIEKGGLSTAGFYNFFKNLEEHVPSTHGAVAGGALGSVIGGPAGALAGAAIGGLISPVASVLRAGQNIVNPNNEQFTKLSNDFVREAKTIFGSRITDNDLKVFMSLVPTLSQTDNGKKQIIENMRAFNRASRVKYDAMKLVIRANGGKRPFDLQQQVEEVAGPELDRLSQQFATS